MSSRLALAMSASALVVALLGSTPLGHAVASQVPRNSVGPLQLKRNAVGPAKVAPNAIRTKHVLDGSLLTADFKPGQIPQGPKGDKGEKGDRGAPGPSGISAREVVTAMSTISSDTSRQVNATCPSGKQVIGGGGTVQEVFVGSPGVIGLTHSGPALGQGWVASAEEMSPYGLNWWMQAYAVCARVE